MEISSNVRYTIPRKYDGGLYGSFCKVMGEGDSFTIYVQVNKEADHPNWLKMSDFLEKTFEKLSENKEFIDACLSLIENKEKEDLKDYVTAISKAIETNF